MGGQAGGRGYLLQAMICLLDMLRNDPGWSEVSIEPDNESEKVDIRWVYGNRSVKAVQVKSSQNQISLAQARSWAEELEKNVVATEYELVLIGPCAKSVLKCSPIGKVSVPTPFALNLKALHEQSAHKLDAYLEDNGISSVRPAARELLVNALVKLLSEYSTAGTTLTRADLDGLLNKWILEFYRPTTTPEIKGYWPRLGWKQLTVAPAVLCVVLVFVEWNFDLSGFRFGPRQIETSVPRAPVDVMRGESFEFDVTARNKRRRGNLLIEYQEQCANPTDGLELDPLFAGFFPVVRPATNAVLRVSGKAVKNGDYRVTIKGKAAAGLLQRELSFERSVDVRVWQSLSLGSRSVKRISPDRRQCEAEFELKAGIRFAHGIDMEAKLVRIPSVRFRGVRFPGTDQFERHEAWNQPGKEVALLVWHTGELSAMHVVTFTLIMNSEALPGKTRDEWESLLEKVQITFSQTR